MLQKPNIYTLVIAVFILISAFFIVNFIWFRPIFIKHFFYRELIHGLKADPQITSKVKVPFFHKRARNKWNDLSLINQDLKPKRLKKQIRQLEKYDPEHLNHKNALSRQIILHHLNNEYDLATFATYNYYINPQTGVQIALADYLDASHHLENNKDVKAYIKRLALIPSVFDQIREIMEDQRMKNCLPPKFVLDQSVKQMQIFINSPPENNFLYSSLKSKIEGHNKIRNADKKLQEAAFILNTAVFPAYESLINYIERIKDDAPAEIGLWQYPDGELFYRHLLKKHSSMDIDPDSAYTIGIEETRRIKDEMIEVLNGMGTPSNQRTVIETIKGIASQPKFLIGNSIQGRIQWIATFDSLIKVGEQQIDTLFYSGPKSSLSVKRVPEYKQKESSVAYYEVPTLDGKGTGHFYVRTDVLDKVPTFEMATLAFHEGIPGHHFQLASNLENKSIPIYRKAYYNNAYIEGWATYAEQLMWENGSYETYSMENIGRLSAELKRAARLVVDIGIHTKKWTYKNAEFYLKKNTTLSGKQIEAEISRYVSDPAQACSYALGLIKMRELKQKATYRLGEKFDLKEFHAVLLNEGMVPMVILEQLVEEYILEKLNTLE